MTATVIDPTAPVALGTTVEIEARGTLTAAGRAYRVLSINGNPCRATVLILGRSIALG